MRKGRLRDKDNKEECNKNSKKTSRMRLFHKEWIASQRLSLARNIESGWNRFGYGEGVSVGQLGAVPVPLPSLQLMRPAGAASTNGESGELAVM